MKMTLTARKVCMFYAGPAPLRIQSFLAMMLPDFGAQSIPLDYTLTSCWVGPSLRIFEYLIVRPSVAASPQPAMRWRLSH